MWCWRLTSDLWFLCGGPEAVRGNMSVTGGTQAQTKEACWGPLRAPEGLQDPENRDQRRKLRSTTEPNTDVWCEDTHTHTHTNPRCSPHTHFLSCEPDNRWHWSL